MPLSRQARGLALERNGDSRAELASIGLIEILSRDPRPTFVVDISYQTTKHASAMLYRNPALHSHFALNEMISGRVIGHLDHEYVIFRDWAMHDNEDPTPRLFGGTSWTAYTLRSRYRIVSGQQSSHEGAPPPIVAASKQVPKSVSSVGVHELQQPLKGLRLEERENGVGVASSFASTGHYAFQCTDLSVPDDHFSPFVQFFRNVDWSSTVLGSMDKWPVQIHHMCNFLMNDPTPAYVLCGPDLNTIYNEAAIHILGVDRHPRVMGLPLKEVYPEVWGQISILIRKVQETGKPVRVEDVPMLLQRNGATEEIFFSFHYQPILDEKGAVLGIYEPFVNVTKQNQTARRLSLLLEISTCSSFAKDISDFWRLLMEALETSAELPFAMLYTKAPQSIEPSPGTSEIARYCELTGHLGIPEGHAILIDKLRLSKSSDGYGPAMRQAMESGQTVFLTTQDGSLPEEFVNGINLRGIATPCNTVVVWPICPTGATSTLGFLIMGLNPYLSVDETMKEFLDIVIRQIVTSVAAVMLFEDEVRHREEVAQQLALRTSELTKSETKFQRMADNSLVGILTADPTGNLLYANKAFYDITGHDGLDNSREHWLELLPEDAAVAFMKTWEQLQTTREPISVESRLKKPWTRTIADGEILSGSTWILISAFVEEDENGSVRSTVATITDISQQKWAEEHQKRRMEEAMELKRQQEAFVDMTSHEIRNPLSAIIQSADSISSSIATHLSSSSKDAWLVSIPKHILEESMDAADTITLCAQHQKSVVDDILTLSKMDADMLLVTPMDVQPLKIVQHIVKMFEPEANKYDIPVVVEVESSFHELGLENVRLDPSRLTQVLVNILGNAIKFTRLVSRKSVRIKVGGSTEIPDDSESGVEYITPHDITVPTAFKGVFKDGSRLCYLRVAVQDTGPGLEPMERERLFTRFGQASPRTEVDYGGSGLGLFISKKLSELQGGGIGLASTPGQGSIFAFYILVQRTVQPTLPSNLDTIQHDDIFREPLLPKHRSIELLTAPKPSPPVLTGPTSQPPPSPPPPDDPQRKLSILVVEDNLVNQRVLCKQLRNLGHTVHAANHGGEALSFLENSSFWRPDGEKLDIMLLDTEMPVMDGLTCAKKIREAEQSGRVRGHVPIVSVTANARSVQVEIARLAGMDDAISKPFRVTNLVPMMYELVRKFEI